MSGDKPTLAELLGAEREAMVRPAGGAARSLEGLRAALAEGREPVVDVPPSAVATPATSGAVVKAGILGGAIAVGIAVVVALLGREDSREEDRADAIAESPGAEAGAGAGAGADSVSDSVSDSVPDSVPDSVSDSVSDSVPDSVPVSDSDSVSDSVPAADAGPASPPPRVKRPGTRRVDAEPTKDGRDSAFAEELRLLREAKRSADAGRPRAALRFLETQARRFPSGFFIEERRALQVRVLCDLGRETDADTARARFLRDFPASPQTERVRSACD